MKCCENGSLHSLVREAIISFEKSPIQNMLLWLWKHLLSKSLLTEASHETVELPAAVSRAKYVALILPLSLRFFFSHQLAHPCYLHAHISLCFSPLFNPLPLKTWKNSELMVIEGLMPRSGIKGRSLVFSPPISASNNGNASGGVILQGNCIAAVHSFKYSLP